MRFVLYCFLLFIISSAACLFAACPKQACLAVVDSGSTGSRLYVYAYNVDDDTGLPDDIETIESYRVNPGLTQIAATQPSVADYLQSLFSQSHSEGIPIYFLATAGMRLQPPDIQARYFQFIRQWFATQPDLALQAVKTISGQEEGIYAWLAINFQMDTLLQPASSQYGVLDLGGASVQIAFPVTDTGMANTHLQVAGKPLNLYVASFLGMGQTQMTHQFLNDQHCFAKNYPLPNGAFGVGAWTQCLSRIDKLTNGVHQIEKVRRFLQHAPSGLAWTAMGSMMYVQREKPFEIDGQAVSLDDFRRQGQQQACEQDWQLLHKQYPGSTSLYLYCLYSAYYYSLIIDGYGFSPFMPIQKLPGRVTPGWTMGVVVRLSLPH